MFFLPMGQLPPSPGMSRTSFGRGIVPLPVAIVLMSIVAMTTSWLPPSAPGGVRRVGTALGVGEEDLRVPQAFPELRLDEVQVTM